jgi:hypothetical protein
VVDVLIRLERTDPPSGTVVVVREELSAAEPDAPGFTGWLGLLRALSEVLEQAGD